MTVLLTEEQKARIAELFEKLAEHDRQTVVDLRLVFDALLKQKPPELTAAEQMHRGCFAEMHVEEIIDQLWPDLVGRVGSDHYDNSLELYFLQEAPDTTRCTEAQAEEVFKLGFSRFWLNFCDDTEQYVYLVENKIHVSDRKKANIPRGGVRQSALRSKLYALIERHEAKLKMIEVYVQHGPMTAADFKQLMEKP